MDNLNLTKEQLEAIAAMILTKEDSKEDSKEESWMDGFERDKSGKITNKITNYVYYFENSPKYKGKIKYNEFKELPELGDKLMDDFDDANFVKSICEDINLETKDKVKTAIDCILGENRYHPIKEYLNKLELKWDGEKRIETIFQKCFEIDDNQLVRSMAKKWFIAAIKRIYEPGCKFDNMIVIQGLQGIGKSTFCENLSKGFYTDISLEEIDKKDIINKLNATWIGIIDEMDRFGKKDMGTIKTFLSKKKDDNRLAFKHHLGEYKRHSVFIGSLNDATFLKDTTSSTERRFWIMKANKKRWDGTINKILTEEVVDQLWAEALTYYKEGNYYLDIDADMMDNFISEQRQFKTFNDDMGVEYIHNILNSKYRLNDKGEFLNDSDFKDQAININMYDRNSYINVIPRNYVTYALKAKYNIERNFKFIEQAISDEWEEKQKVYNGIKGVRCYVRKNLKTNDNAPAIEDSVIPF